MNLFVRLTGADRLAHRLAARLPLLQEQGIAQAARAVAEQCAEAGVSPTIRADGAGLRVGSADAAAVRRETGTLDTPPDPWLAPALARLRRRG
ncbi:MAG: hypothetical protein B7Z15_04465 [Rhizobiales bacterium 32-66-8]|nr:MAG: hypothetical protein B7Z15_04465 [Rhizobiales bacterium 32-66-8]